MKKDNVNNKMISTEDMKFIKEMAIKYNIGVPEFGRQITRQAKDNKIRQIRLTEDEKKLIVKVQKANGVSSMGRWCALACDEFIQNGDYDIFFSDEKEEKGVRDKRINVPILSHKVEAELLEISSTYSIKFASLVRYIVLLYSKNLVK